MPMSKLTLSADKRLISAAKRLAVARQTSVSSMFARYLEALVQTDEDQHEPVGPLTEQATGLVTLPKHRSDRDVLTEALLEKYHLRS